MRRFRHNPGSPEELFRGAYDAVMEDLRRGGDTSQYMAVLQGCVAVLKGAGWDSSWRELGDIYHDPLASYSSDRDAYFNKIGLGLNEWWERDGRFPPPHERALASRYEYARAPDFGWLDDQISAQLKKLKIRRGTKRYREFMAELRPRAVAGAAESAKEIAFARSIRIDGEISRVLKDVEAKSERAERIERKAAVGMALIEAAGAGPSDAALVAMKDSVDRADAAVAELEDHARYLESTKKGEDPREIAAAWWERTYGV